eukprot:s5011_g3.t1
MGEVLGLIKAAFSRCLKCLDGDRELLRSIGGHPELPLKHAKRCYERRKGAEIRFLFGSAAVPWKMHSGIGRIGLPQILPLASSRLQFTLSAWQSETRGEKAWGQMPWPGGQACIETVASTLQIHYIQVDIPR